MGCIADLNDVAAVEVPVESGDSVDNDVVMIDSVGKGCMLLMR